MEIAKEEIGFILAIIYIAMVPVTLFLVWLIFLRGPKIRRHQKDKSPAPQHKHLLRPPTWRFQKLHPIDCPHHNGIYRKILDNNKEKTIFVCADCVSIVETEELELRDKFKGQENGRLSHTSKHN